MYEAFFGFTEPPFSLNPDPGFLYLGRNHSKALSILEFGLASEAGITVITGAIGSGKTTLVRHLLNTMPENRTVGLITNTHKAFGELIHWISMAFDLEHEGRDKVSLYNQFMKFMIDEYAKGNRVVLIVDEAQNLDADMIEELRVISNINADKDLVLQLMLVGQPELKETLSGPDLVQFVQRISAYYHLKPLKLDEARKYIKHRVTIAGLPRNPFRDEAVDLVFATSAGVPRLINTLCHLALTYCFAEGRKTVTVGIMREILSDREEHGLFGLGMDQAQSDTDKTGAMEVLRQHHMGSTPVAKTEDKAV
jgi:general secretion pathway protein A